MNQVVYIIEILSPARRRVLNSAREAKKEKGFQSCCGSGTERFRLTTMGTESKSTSPTGYTVNIISKDGNLFFGADVCFWSTLSSLGCLCNIYLQLRISVFVFLRCAYIKM